MNTNEKRAAYNVGNQNASKEVTKDDILNIRVVGADKLKWAHKADREGESLSSWVSSVLNKEVENEK